MNQTATTVYDCFMQPSLTASTNAIQFNEIFLKYNELCRSLLWTPARKPLIYLEWTQLEENTREGVAPD